MDKEHFLRSVFKELKKSKLIFNTHEWVTGYKDIRVQRELHSGDHRKTKEQIRNEINLIKQYWHCGTFHYYRYGLIYMDLSKEELLDYVPTYYHHKVLEKAHAGIDTVIYGDKLTQAKLFQTRNIPTANILAICNKHQWYDLKGRPITEISTIIEEYFKNNINKLFLKPTGGQGGFGIRVLKHADGKYVLDGKEIEPLSKLSSELENCQYIMQEGVRQSEQMMGINDSSVNTLRVVVQKEGDKMKMRTCIIRMGRKGREVDNSAQGGISVKVDIETGQVASTATAEHGGGVLTCHPDSKMEFAGIVIQNWGKLKSEIEAIGTKLIDFKNIALDIAVTDEGAKLLEFNFRYGIEHQQCVLGGVRKLLGIYPDC